MLVFALWYKEICTVSNFSAAFIICFFLFNQQISCNNFLSNTCIINNITFSLVVFIHKNLWFNMTLFK